MNFKHLESGGREREAASTIEEMWIYIYVHCIVVSCQAELCQGMLLNYSGFILSLLQGLAKWVVGTYRLVDVSPLLGANLSSFMNKNLNLFNGSHVQCVSSTY